MTSKTTQSFADKYIGSSMKEIPELASLVEKVSVDSMRWVTIYRCKESGEEWEESFESIGHGDIPTVRRKVKETK